MLANMPVLISPNGKEYTNFNNLPLLTCVFAMYMNENGYTGSTSTNENLISVTSLISPIRKYLYKRKYPDLETTLDISNLLASAKGTALHNAFESAIAWYGDSNIESETRIDEEFEGMIISGEFDFLEDNMIKDLKHVSNYSMKKLLEDKENLQYTETIEEQLTLYPTYTKYQLQLSLYRWLIRDRNPELRGSIIFSLNNGAGFEGYAVDQEVVFPLFDTEQIEEFIKSRLDSIKHYIETDTMPYCTDEERGMTQPEYKLQRYSAKTGKMRTVNGSKHTDYNAFRNYVIAKGKPGDVEEIKPAVGILCSYCLYSDICDQNVV